MSIIYIDFLIFLYFCFFPLSNESFINNPRKTDREINPIDCKIIYLTETAKIQKETVELTLDVIKDFIKFTHDSFIISQQLLAVKDGENIYFLFVEDNYYTLTLSSENEISSLSLKKCLSSDIKYIDFILSDYYAGEIALIGKMSPVKQEEIVLYGKSGQYIDFYYKTEDVVYSVYFGDIEENISCKSIKEAIYICAFSSSNQIKLKFFVKIYKERTIQGRKEIKDLGDREVSAFSNHDMPIFYNTSDSQYKILCAREKTNNNIECITIEFDATYNSATSSFTLNLNFYEIINEYQTTFSYNEDNCNLTSYNSEYLICCGVTGAILCDKRDINFNLINTFSINCPGKIRNLTYEIEDDIIKLIYSNETTEEKYIYEYTIYPPECTNISVTINFLQTEKINLNELYERKMNTKYYITLKRSPSYMISTKINDVQISDDDPVLLSGEENHMYFISNGLAIGSNKFYYNISITELFAKTCSIDLVVKACYSSCLSCSKSAQNSNEESHNCIGCKENYYPFRENGTNCYTKDQVTNYPTEWYFDENKNVFEPCNYLCKTCSGPTEENCLSCPLLEENQLYLFTVINYNLMENVYLHVHLELSLMKTQILVIIAIKIV